VTDDVHGPIDYILLEFPLDSPTGGAGQALLDLVAQGLVRIYDIVVISVDDEGTAEVVDLTEIDRPVARDLAALAGARSGLLGDEDVTAAGETLLPGSLGALVVFENAWASPFVRAVRDAGGGVVSSGRIAADDVLAVLDALDETDD
jgi:hypothetical protein